MYLWPNQQDFLNRTSLSLEELGYYCRNQDNFVFEDDSIINGRIFYKPSRRYKKILRIINRAIQEYKLPDYFYGTRKKVSAIDCAMVHINSEYILKLDLKHYFPNTNEHRIYRSISRLTPDTELAKLLTKLCTYNHQLPQGFPTSPILAEITLMPIASHLKKICDAQNLIISIYIDDICVSGSSPLLALQNQILEVFAKRRFILNLEKKKLVHCSKGIEQTGVFLKDRFATTLPSFDKSLIELINGFLQNAYWFGCITNKEIRAEKAKIYGKINYMSRIDKLKSDNMLAKLTNG